MAHTYSHGDSSYLTDAQLGQLLKGINPLRVNKDAKGMSYVEAYEIRAHLTRIFGPLRWDEVITDQRVVFESSSEPTRDGDKPRWTVCWYAHCTLTVRSANGATLATYGEGATGDATNFPSRADAHDMAAKTAASQALKRCAMNLGDNFGLSLYQKGSIRPLVGRTLIWDPSAEAQIAADVAEHISSPLAPESGEPAGESQREVTSPPASKAPPAAETAPDLPEDAPVGTVTTVAGMEFTKVADDPFPTAPDADGGSPAGSGEPVSESPAEEPAVETDPTASGHVAETADEAATPESAAAVSSAEPGSSAETVDPTTPAGQGPADPTPGNGSEPTAEPSGIEDPIDAWEHITAALAVIRMSPPEEALGILNDAMEMAARFGLGTRRYLDTDKALSVVLTDTMRDARAAIERRRAAAAGAS